MALDLREYLFANFARSTLAVALSEDGTELVLENAVAFPEPDYTGQQIFSVVLMDADGFEIVYCTSRVGSTLTVERGAEETTPRAWAAGTPVVHDVTAGFFAQRAIEGPTAPVLTLDDSTITSADLSWTESEPVVVGQEVLGYNLYRTVDEGEAELFAELGLVLTYSDDTLDRTQHSYTYFVRAVPSVGALSAPSNVVDVVGLSPVVIALQNGSTVLRTLDGGESWAAASIGLSATWTGGAYSPSLGRLLIVNTDGATNRMAYSDDGGQTWTLIPGQALAGSARIAWSESAGLFVAIGNAVAGVAQFYTSPTGITWTLNNTGARGDMDYQDVVWFEDGGVFVATGNAGAFDHVGVVTSPDGVTWTQRTAADGGWSHATLLTVIGTRVYGFGPSSSTYVRSLDGITWEGGSGPFGAPASYTGLPDESRFIRCRASVNAVEYASTYNGSYTFVDLGQLHNSALYSQYFERFITMGQDEAAYSDDGVTWNQEAVSFTNVSRHALIEGLYSP